MAGSALLVIDTATSRTTVALLRAAGAPIDEMTSTGPERGAASLGTRLAGLLSMAGIAPRDLAAVGVGTGPGSFTGLRVGLATAKTLAWSLGIPLVGIPTVDGLRRAAAVAWAGTDGIDGAGLAVIQSAGARDHYLALPGEAPRLVASGTDLAAAVGGHAALALDVAPARLAGIHGPRGLDPLAAGGVARAGLGAASLVILGERLAAGATDDVASLIPAYVALPRGIGATAAGAGWTPELR